MRGTALDPLTNAPPWIQTSTGSPCAPGSGVHTLRLRYSSPATTGFGSSASNGGGYPGMGAVGPWVTASRTPVHGATGSGARKRRSPTGAAAYGTPRKATTPPVRTPCTAPAAVSAMIDVAVLTGRAFRAGCRPRNGAGPDQRRVAPNRSAATATAASRAALASSFVKVRSGARNRRANASERCPSAT